MTDYYRAAGLVEDLEACGFYLVGYGCTTCIGNSGPLPRSISDEIAREGLVVAAVLSGNRNFEGRINSDVRANYLMSPPLVVAYALAGRVDVDLRREPLGKGKDGKPVWLRRPLAVAEELREAREGAATRDVPRGVRPGARGRRALEVPARHRRRPLRVGRRLHLRPAPAVPRGPARGAPASWTCAGPACWRCSATAITTDHISPAGSISRESPAGRYLLEQSVAPEDFNSYGARRGNHEVMMRGTFANVRLRNRLAPGTEGGVTRHLPSGELLSIYRRGHALPRGGHPAAGAGGARTTAPGRAATGPRRDRCCSACAP